MATVRATCAARVYSGAFASESRGDRRASGIPRSAARDKREGFVQPKKRSYIILPADGGFSNGDAGWTLWQESEAGSVLVGTRRARRRRQQMSEHWRKIMSLGGVEGAEPEDVAKRLHVALELIEKERADINNTLHELERGNKGADVLASKVKQLKVRKLHLKDDALRIQNALAVATNASELGEGSFGRVFLGKETGGGDVAVKVEDVARAMADAGALDLVQMSSIDDDSDDDDDEVSGTDIDVSSRLPKTKKQAQRMTPLRLEEKMLTRVCSVSGPAGFPKVHHFGEQKVFGRASHVLVMDLLGPSLEEMSWAVSAGGPLR
jgi:hypothetical protein